MPELPTLYSISPSKDSTIAIEVTKTGLLARKKKHTLCFENFSGQMSLVSNDPTASQILLTIDAGSIVCRSADVSAKEQHTIAAFAREEALAANRYREIQFTSTAIRAKALRGFVVTGVLQIRGTTRELKVNMAWNPKRDNKVQLDGDATVRLSDFGLPAPAAKFGLVRTVDEMMVHLLLWAAPVATAI